MEAHRADIVEFIRLGLELDVLSHSSIVAWADSVIAPEDEPPAWSIDLAMSTKEDVHDILRHIPLASRSQEPFSLLLGYVAQLWQQRIVDLDKAVGCWSQVYYRDFFDSAGERLLSMGPHVDAYYDEFSDGYCPRQSMEATADEALLPFLSEAEKLPAQLRPPIKDGL